MTHYADLTEYVYMREAGRPGTANVGWLDSCSSFPKGRVPDLFVDRLMEYCLRPVIQTRGFHRCDLCVHRRIGPLLFECNLHQLKLGSAEIRVIGGEGVLYAAPDLVIHYVRDHFYRPPDAFVDAVMNADFSPTSLEYEAMIERLEFR